MVTGDWEASSMSDAVYVVLVGVFMGQVGAGTSRRPVLRLRYQMADCRSLGVCFTVFCCSL